MSDHIETTRLPVSGSCHCGKVRYAAWLTLPKAADADLPDRPPNTITRMYKCNCTICHKASVFHVRLVDAPNDFILLDPPSEDRPLDNMGDYLCNQQLAHWYFCKSCGVRMFVMRARGEVARVDVDEFCGRKPSGQLQSVWRMQKEGYVEGKGSHFSINGPTLDQVESGIDLRQWHERGWVRYLDEWKDIGGWEKKPHEGGMY